MDGGVQWTDIAQVALVGAQLLVLIAAALFTWRQVKHAREQVREARELREEQNRPFVVVDFDVEGGYLTFLEVANLGTSLARDVQIEIDPPLESASDVDMSNLKMLNEGIVTLAPGKKYRTFFDMGFRRADSDLPMNYTAKVSYWDEKRKRRFDETLNLDLDLFMNLKTITRHDVHDIHKQLEEIRNVIKKWTAGTGSGLLAMSLEEVRDEGERRMAAMEERERKREAQDES